MSFGSRRLQACKKKGISQEEPAAQMGTKGLAIGRYECNKAKLFIGAASNMARIQKVPLDWFVSNTDIEIGTTIINRIQNINNLSQKDKNLVFEFLDSFIANRKTKIALK